MNFWEMEGKSSVSQKIEDDPKHNLKKGKVVMDEPCEHMDRGFPRRPRPRVGTSTDESCGPCVTVASQAAKSGARKKFAVRKMEANCMTHLTNREMKNRSNE